MKSKALLPLASVHLAHCGQIGILVCVTALLDTPTGGRAAVITVPAAADTFIYSGSPDNNAGANPWFGAGTDGHGETRRGLLRFNLGSIPAGSIISAAEFSSLPIRNRSDSMNQPNEL